MAINRAKLLLATAVLGIFSAFSAGEAVQRDVFIDIEVALSVGNAKKLSDLLSSSVELALPGEQEGIYSKEQTLVILNRFFNRYPPSAFKIVHKGNSAAGSRFAVGDYTTGSDKTFRVTIFVKKYGESHLIQEIEFE
ncbi:MAG: DUF4783 domain-containing protein [Bacteroidetes bacterium]|nr:DUF4783 domain-containing protein [Bacteroidota bacterium]